MALTLKIENMASLPDGGPLTYSIQGKRGLDIGRDQYLDWTLPDPSRFISGKHCEVRWHDGGYWLHDVSTNGTFLDGSDSRLKGPHRLRNGDRFAIGHYIVSAAIDGEGEEDVNGGHDAPPPRPSAPSFQSLWDSDGDAAPPVDPRDLKAPRDLKPVRPDFMDYAVDVPEAYPGPSSLQAPASPPPSRPAPAPSLWDAPASAPPPTSNDMDWAQGAPKPPPPEPEVAAVPQPRRPVWVSSEPEGPWAAKTPSGPPARPAPPLPSSLRSADGPEADVLAAAQAFSAAASGLPVPSSAGGNAAMADFVRLFARGAGLPEDALAARDPAELAQELGQIMRLITENVRQLLEARQMAKRMARSSNQTMIQALNNNPLKFSPSEEDALRVMFGPQTRSYLDARRALTQSFDDLKSHQVKTFSAMQQALRLMLGEFDPDVIDNSAVADRGIAAVVGSRKARLWDIYVARWQARTQNHSDGMLKAYMDYFADCYDRDDK
jgi:type VI secretion system protein ImpI